MQKSPAALKLKRPLVFVGLMGAGKTSVGKLVAKRLGLEFVDTDSEIVAAAGCSVIDIFSLYGEQEFRRVEDRVIRRLLSDETPRVISTGEGAFITDSVRKMLKEKAITVWLKADLTLLVKRTGLKNTRPQLLDRRPEEILDSLMENRYPIYAEADMTVETKDEPTNKTALNVIAALGRFLKGGAK